MLYPEVCPICCKCGPAPCSDCAAAVVEGASRGKVPDGLDDLVALALYQHVGAQLVRAVKFANKRDALRWASVELAQRVGHLSFDFVTWVPSSGSTLRHRGFEPARLLAQEVAAILEVPVVAALSRRSDDVGQRSKNRRERLLGPSLRLRRNIPGPSVLLLDDVVTTGATLSESARILRSAGASYVHGAVLARRP